MFPATPSHKLTRNAFFLLTGQVGSTALALILAAVLGRWLGAVDYGVYYLLVTVSMFAYVFVDWGQSAYLVREVARHREDIGELLGSALAFRAVAACVVALATAVLAKAFVNDSRTDFLALVAVVCGLPLALSQTYGYVFRGRNRMDLDAIVSVAGKALTVLLTVPAVLSGSGLAAVFPMQAMGGAGAFLVAVLLARKILLKAQPPQREIVEELAKGGAPIAAFFLSMAVQPFIDVIVLSAMVPPAVVGWYGAARNIIGVLFVPALIVVSASFPELSRVTGSVQEMRRVLSATMRMLLALGALTAVGTVLFADVAVALIYGPGHFDPAVAVLQIFAPLLPLLFMDTLFGTALTAAGKTNEIAVVKALSVAVSTILSILLIPVCQAYWGNGGIGLVLAFGSTEVMMLIAFLLVLPGGTVNRSILLDFLRAIAAGGGTGMIFWALPSMPPWIAMPASIGVFMILAFASGLLLKTDLDKVTELFRSKHEKL